MNILRTVILLTFELITLSNTDSQAQDYITLHKNHLLAIKAQNYLNYAQYDSAIYLYKQSFIEGNICILDYYNIAKSYAHKGDSNMAIYFLKLCSMKGYNDYEGTIGDTSFLLLRNSLYWNKILLTIKTNYQQNNHKYGKILKKLNKIYYTDQFLRNNVLDSVITRFGFSSSQANKIFDSIDVVDSLNLCKIDSIIKKWGWLSPIQVGKIASSTIFLVIQHSSISTQLKYLPILVNAVHLRKTSVENYCLFIDRICLEQNKPQLYGTQIIRNQETGNLQLYTLKNPEKIDSIRNCLGLIPLTEYMKDFGIYN